MDQYRKFLRESAVAKEELDIFLDPSEPSWAQFDQALSCMRIFVENAIAGIKRLNVLVHAFRNRKENMKDLVIAFSCRDQ